ncbi:hypothetical protein NW762_005335 [Fusarium torreyae]|uniref:DUF7924 domain-containing protein n=1 Tax=Fusarium torreyae TaxID=1237075 RepID=A0A9W8S434_9HYPO|nr:hypothetical protein NW762_005335 [Fusarium torreyae]
MEMEASEAEVEEFFRNNVAPRTSREDPIRRSDRIIMNKTALPPFQPQYKISNPVPDMLYGYNRSSAFGVDQRKQIADGGNVAVANSEGLLCPFFAIEFKGDGPSSNASTACINISEQLIKQLSQCNREEVKRLDSTSFSIAMNGTEARLTFILQRPNEFLEFRKYVRNIIDWGRDERLRTIKAALDALIEERLKVASKTRPPPIDKSGEGSKRQRPN